MKRQLLLTLAIVMCCGLTFAQPRSASEPDITAPVVVSTDPAISGEVVYTLRPVIRIEYDKELNWDEDKNGNCITVTDAAGNEYAGKLTHAVVRNKSVLHFYFNNDLPLDKAFLVTVKGGLNDLYGNPTDDFFFRFLSEYRPQTAQETVLALDNTSGWWVPNGSGSTKGLVSDEDGNTWTSSSAITASQASNSSCWLHYTFDPSSADGIWQIREYYSLGSTTSHSNTNGILTFWLYGDASNNSVSAMLRATSSSGGLKYQEPQTKIDFRGWKLVTWDLKNDNYAAFSGTDALSSAWRFDSFFLRHVNESGVNKEWHGDLYFDNLEFNKWDNSATRTAKLDDVTIPSGIEDVVIDSNSPAEYFNLQGMKVILPSKGIFIKRQGNKTSKVVL